MANRPNSVEELLKSINSKAVEKISEQELIAILADKLERSINYYTDIFGNYRIEADRLYEGKPMGTEVEGRSQVVSRDVAEAIDSVVPGLMRIFENSGTICRLLPNSPDTIEQAAQQTAYANYIWSVRNNGFTNLQDFCKAGLLNRIGILKIYWDEKKIVTEERAENLTEQELLYFAKDPDLDIQQIEAYDDPVMDVVFENQKKIRDAVAIANGIDPNDLPPMVDPEDLPANMRYDVIYNKTKERGRIKIDLVPTEELLFDQWTSDQEQHTFFAHRRKISKSEYRLMNYPTDLIDKITWGQTDEELYMIEKQVRFEKEHTTNLSVELLYDDSTWNTWISECYITVDWDGDGIAEYRRIVVCGANNNFYIVDNEMVDRHPFVIFSPIRIPFKMVGQSVVDQTGDIQKINTTLLRNLLDNQYFTLNNRPIINKNVTLTDILTARPGAPIRCDNPTSDIVYQNVPDVTPSILSALNWMGDMRDRRTGITPQSQGLDIDELNVESGRAVALLQEAGAMRMELIARNLGDAIGRAFQLIVSIASKHQLESDYISVQGKFLPIRPVEWNREFDVEVMVGLGTNNQQARVAKYQQVLAIQQQAIQLQTQMNPTWAATGPLVTLNNVHNTLKEMVDSLGLPDASPYFTDPTAFIAHLAANPPPQPPNPEEQKLQAEMQYKNQRLQFDQQHAASKMTLAQQKMQIDAELDQARLMQKNAEANKKLQLEAVQIVADAKNDVGNLKLDTAKFAHEVAKPFIDAGLNNG